MKRLVHRACKGLAVLLCLSLAANDLSFAVPAFSPLRSHETTECFQQQALQPAVLFFTHSLARIKSAYVRHQAVLRYTGKGLGWGGLGAAVYISHQPSVILGYLVYSAVRLVMAKRDAGIHWKEDVKWKAAHLSWKDVVGGIFVLNAFAYFAYQWNVPISSLALSEPFRIFVGGAPYLLAVSFVVSRTAKQAYHDMELESEGFSEDSRRVKGLQRFSWISASLSTAVIAALLLLSSCTPHTSYQGATIYPNTSQALAAVKPAIDILPKSLIQGGRFVLTTLEDLHTRTAKENQYTGALYEDLNKSAEIAMDSPGASRQWLNWTTVHEHGHRWDEEHTTPAEFAKMVSLHEDAMKGRYFKLISWYAHYGQTKANERELVQFKKSNPEKYFDLTGPKLRDARAREGFAEVFASWVWSSELLLDQSGVAQSPPLRYYIEHAAKAFVFEQNGRHVIRLYRPNNKEAQNPSYVDIPISGKALSYSGLQDLYRRQFKSPSSSLAHANSASPSSMQPAPLPSKPWPWTLLIGVLGPLGMMTRGQFSGDKKNSAGAPGGESGRRLSSEERAIILSGQNQRSTDGEDVILARRGSERRLEKRLSREEREGQAKPFDFDVEGKDVLVVPGYANNGFLLAEHGATSVTVYDADPVTIAWLKAVRQYFHYRGLEGAEKYSIGELFMGSVDGRTDKYLLSRIQQAVWDVPEDAAHSYAWEKDITFYAGRLEKIPAGEKFDFIFVPWLLGIPHGIEDLSSVMHAIRDLTTHLRPEGRMAITPSVSFNTEPDGLRENRKEGLFLTLLRKTGYAIQNQWVDHNQTIVTIDMARSRLFPEDIVPGNITDRDISTTIELLKKSHNPGTGAYGYFGGNTDETTPSAGTPGSAPAGMIKDSSAARKHDETITAAEAAFDRLEIKEADRLYAEAKRIVIQDAPPDELSYFTPVLQLLVDIMVSNPKLSLKEVRDQLKSVIKESKDLFVDAHRQGGEVLVNREWVPYKEESHAWQLQELFEYVIGEAILNVRKSPGMVLLPVPDKLLLYAEEIAIQAHAYWNQMRYADPDSLMGMIGAAKHKRKPSRGRSTLSAA